MTKPLKRKLKELLEMLKDRNDDGRLTAPLTFLDNIIHADTDEEDPAPGDDGDSNPGGTPPPPPGGIVTGP